MGIGENIMKYWKYYALVTAMVTVGGWLYKQGVNNRETETRIFTTEGMRYETEKYMNSKPSAKQEIEKFFRDSIKAIEVTKNSESARKSRAMRDSTLVEETKARKVTDSINRLNADQLYQIKEEFQEIKNLIKGLNNE